MSVRNLLLVSLLGVVIAISGCAPARHGDTPPDKESTPENWSDTGFFDDFSNTRLLNWSTLSGRWSVKGRALTCRGESTIPFGFNHIIVPKIDMSNGSVEADLRFESASMDAGNQFAGILFRYQDQYNYYLAQICDISKYQGRLEVFKMVNGQRSQRIGESYLLINPKQWFHIEVVAQGASIVVMLDGKTKISVKDTDFDSGMVGLSQKGSSTQFDDFRVTQSKAIQK
jgi:3-keto-disaccharide hydrolase